MRSTTTTNTLLQPNPITSFVHSYHPDDTPEEMLIDERKRFFSNVLKLDDPNACWLWYGPIRKSVRGGLKSGRFTSEHPWFKTSVAHRVAWFLEFNEWLDDSTFLVQICTNKLCVNTRHLKPIEASDMKRLIKQLKSHVSNRWSSIEYET